MAKTFNREFAAAVLVEAMFTTNLKAAEKYDIDDRTIRNYRAKLAEDPKLYALFVEKKAEFDRAWAEELPGALRKGVRMLSACVEAASADPLIKKSPQVIEAVTGVVKMLAEVQIVSRMIDARLAEQSGAGGTEARADVPGAGK
jgi:hypothetical protein